MICKEINWLRPNDLNKGSGALYCITLPTMLERVIESSYVQKAPKLHPRLQVHQIFTCHLPLVSDGGWGCS